MTTPPTNSSSVRVTHGQPPTAPNQPTGPTRTHRARTMQKERMRVLMNKGKRSHYSAKRRHASKKDIEEFSFVPPTQAPPPPLPSSSASSPASASSSSVRDKTSTATEKQQQTGVHKLSKEGVSEAGTGRGQVAAEGDGEEGVVAGSKPGGQKWRFW